MSCRLETFIKCDLCDIERTPNTIPDDWSEIKVSTVHGNSCVNYFHTCENCWPFRPAQRNKTHKDNLIRKIMGIFK